MGVLGRNFLPSVLRVNAVLLHFKNSVPLRDILYVAVFGIDVVAHGACIAGTSVPVAYFACLGVKGKAAHIVQQICFELAVLGYPAVVILREIHLLEKLVKGFVGADDIRLGERYVFGMVNAVTRNSAV